MSNIQLKVKTSKGHAVVYVERHVDTCPHCNVAVKPLILGSDYQNSSHLDIFYKCPRNYCGRTFIGVFMGRTYDEFYFSYMIPARKILTREFDMTIKETSPSFVQIYNEAYSAEQTNLKHICGMGYRKALEFLIKDYVISTLPSSVDVVANHKTTLSRVIKEFINDPRIVKTAERASWLGNDETHYVRKWEDKDINDLKILIDLVIHWIVMERLTETYLNNMN